MVNNGFPKGLLTLWRSPEAEPLVGCGATNANNLSVIGIYPAKKSNRNQKNKAQKESIGLCKKRIDKMEMPTKSK